MRLRDLDDRLVPRMAAGLRSMLDGVSGGGQEILGRGGALRRLDDRFASRGPLKLLRDVPQLALLIVTAVFLAGTGAALALQEPQTGRDQVTDAVQRDASLPLVLGPAVGQDIDQHFAAAAGRLAEVAEDDPDAEHLALVSLTDPLTPEQTAAFAEEGAVEVRAAYLRAPVPGAPEEISFEPPGDLVEGLREIFSQTALRKAEDQQELLAQAETIPPGTPEEEAFRRQFVADARMAGLEAAAYRIGCPCVFAMVVEGEARVLAALAKAAGVRGVELAPKGAELSALDVQPLAPTEKGVVAPPPIPGSEGS